MIEDFGPNATWRGGGSGGNKRKSDSVIILPSPVFERIIFDTALTLEAFDEIVGITSDKEEWTWEIVVAAMKKKGMTPRETAQKLGLLEW